MGRIRAVHAPRADARRFRALTPMRIQPLRHTPKRAVVTACKRGFAKTARPQEREVNGMKRTLGAFATAAPLLLAMSVVPAVAQQSGGILRIGHFASPASMSMLEESTQAVNRPISGVFNNLIIFKQDEPQNTPDSIIP